MPQGTQRREKTVLQGLCEETPQDKQHPRNLEQGMTYTAINDFVIVEKVQDEKTVSGIILTSESKPLYRVVETTDVTKDLSGKIIELLQENHALPLSDGKHFSVNYKNIIAVKVCT